MILVLIFQKSIFSQLFINPISGNIFVLPEIQGLDSFNLLLDYCLLCRGLVIILQPFCFSHICNLCFGIFKYCMGNEQPLFGICEGFACVSNWPSYISIVANTTLSSLFQLLFQNPSTSFKLSLRALNWVPPPFGTLKINVHIEAFAAPMPNGNTTGIGVVIRISDGSLVNCITDVIPGLNYLGSQPFTVRNRLLLRLTTSRLMVLSSSPTSISIRNMMVLFTRSSQGSEIPTGNAHFD